MIKQLNRRRPSAALQHLSFCSPILINPLDLLRCTSFISLVIYSLICHLVVTLLDKITLLNELQGIV